MVLVFTMLSTVALGLMVNQIRPTQFERKRAQTLDNAQAGLDAGLALVRNARLNGTTVGVPGLVPCNTVDHDHITGSVDGAGSGTNAYAVDIYYFGVDSSNNPIDPSGMTVAQVIASSNKMSCNASTGGLAAAPTFAYLVSVGSAPALPNGQGGTSGSQGNRQLHASYQFTTSNNHPVGGQISFVTAAGHNDCWDAGSPPLGGGTVVTYQSCGPIGTPAQTWLYRNDLSIQWQGDLSKNLCLDYSGFTRVVGSVQPIKLQPCLGDGNYSSAWDNSNQRYSINGSASSTRSYQEFGEGQGFIGVDPQGVPSTNNYAVSYYGDRDSASCIQSVNANSSALAAEPGDSLAMVYSNGQCSGGDNSTSESSGTGAGAAAGDTSGLPSSTTGQLVTYASSNRCIDVKDSIPSRGLINYPCHESPNILNLEQNERFTSPAAGTPGQITVYRDQGPSGVYYNFGSKTAPYCLGSDHSTTNYSNSTEPGFFVTVAACTGIATQRWTLAGATSANYSDRYTIKDSSGYCLTAGTGPPDAPEGFAGWYQEKETYVGLCTGQDNQKWNAPPGVTSSPLKGYGEDVRP